MKFQTVAALVGLAGAVEVGKITNQATPQEDDALVQAESDALADTCKDYASIDDDSLVGLDLEEEADADHLGSGHSSKTTHKKGYIKAHRGTYHAHFGKSKAAIHAENKAILSAQGKCLGFLKKHPGHSGPLCHWCKTTPEPRIRWKWVTSEHVWYRWWSGKWHYWGPSKKGFTASGWTWYGGYWHHGGYVFRWSHGTWYRFQGGKWVIYGKTVPIKPAIPRERDICRPFMILRTAAFPDTLAAHKVSRCQVGSGKSAAIYQWKDDDACNFLGGKRVQKSILRCKDGTAHKWQRVQRCVKGAVISGARGANFYKNGGHNTVKTVTKIKQEKQGGGGTTHFHGSTTHTTTTSVTTIGGLTVGSCYKLRSFLKHKEYLTDYKGQARNLRRNSRYKKGQTWKIGTDGKGHITLNRKKETLTASGGLVRGNIMGVIKKLRYANQKKLSTFTVAKFRGIHRGNQFSLMLSSKPGHFLVHEKSPKGKKFTYVVSKKYSTQGRDFIHRASWTAIKTKC